MPHYYKIGCSNHLGKRVPKLFICKEMDSKLLLEFSEDFIPRPPILEADTLIPQSIAGLFKFNKSIHKEGFQIKQILKETNGNNFTSFISSKYIK